MSPADRFFLHVHVPGAGSYELGDEILQQSLAEAIEAEARTIADYAGAELLEQFLTRVADLAERDADHFISRAEADAQAASAIRPPLRWGLGPRGVHNARSKTVQFTGMKYIISCHRALISGMWRTSRYLLLRARFRRRMVFPERHNALSERSAPDVSGAARSRVRRSAP